MNPCLLAQPLPPSPAKGSAARPLRAVGVAFFLALAAFLLWGDAAHAQEVSDTGPAPSQPAVAPAEDPAPAEPAEAPAEPTESAEPTEAPAEPVEPADDPVDSPAPAPAPNEPVEAGEAADQPAVGDDPAPVTDETVEPAAPTVPAAVLPPPPSSFARVIEARRVAIQAHTAPAVHQCNADTYPTGAGWEATCVVTIENTLNADGSTSSRVTTTWCLAEAGVLPPEGCTTDVTTSDQLVTSVDQCNGILAGGSNVTCSVEVINNVPAGTPTTGVTVNQCIGSGQGGVSPGGPPTKCDPVDSSTSGATVTQCNGSANGGGGPERVQCAVAGATTALPMTVNQCNGSTAAGSTVTCDVTFTNNFAVDETDSDDGGDGGSPTPLPVVPVSFTPTGAGLDAGGRGLPAPASSSSAARSRNASATSLAATGPVGSTTGLLALAVLLLLLGGLLVTRSSAANRN